MFDVCTSRFFTYYSSGVSINFLFSDSQCFTLATPSLLVPRTTCVTTVQSLVYLYFSWFSTRLLPDFFVSLPLFLSLLGHSFLPGFLIPLPFCFRALTRSLALFLMLNRRNSRGGGRGRPASFGASSALRSSRQVSGTSKGVFLDGTRLSKADVMREGRARGGGKARHMKNFRGTGGAMGGSGLNGFSRKSGDPDREQGKNYVLCLEGESPFNLFSEIRPNSSFFRHSSSRTASDSSFCCSFSFFLSLRLLVREEAARRTFKPQKPCGSASVVRRASLLF